jgi:hypothetical protein
MKSTPACSQRGRRRASSPGEVLLPQRSCQPVRKRVAGRRGQRVELVVESFEGRKHLPVVTLRRAA